MKVVILAGGYGSRISEESHLKPKPMVEIGGRPILWHIMKEYSYYGFHDFIICAGYKQHIIKQWFADYYLYNSDITIDFCKGGQMTVHNHTAEPWKVTIIDTGLDTMTGGRILRVQKYIGDEPFLLTYGDGVSDINIRRLAEFHKKHKKAATLTAVYTEQRFGILEIGREDHCVRAFREKSQADGSRINAGYMVLEPEVFSYLKDDRSIFEQETIQQLIADGQLYAYQHDGFWQCMDTKREKEKLAEMVAQGRAPWMVWDRGGGEGVPKL